MDKKLKELVNLFEHNKKQIDILDNQINQLVYKLYGLTEDEIKLVLSSLGPAYYLVDAPAGYGKTIRLTKP